ncbi:hypothetical protein CBR_g30053 [Chara braunii]|uniref:Uncharacterized protein n=1 Tax=Chara braunii TaxID=69332 RepID=A0A388LBW2_CHABU|nr:hypothetical protein CBR_g30053 [Chara braunii]|eukprot:GBG79791.1 hypothetical protein CBR_g30053 [Chara braunii]
MTITKGGFACVISHATLCLQKTKALKLYTIGLGRATERTVKVLQKKYKEQYHPPLWSRKDDPRSPQFEYSSPPELILAHQDGDADEQAFKLALGKSKQLQESKGASPLGKSQPTFQQPPGQEAGSTTQQPLGAPASPSSLRTGPAVASALEEQREQHQQRTKELWKAAKGRQGKISWGLGTWQADDEEDDDGDDDDRDEDDDDDEDDDNEDRDEDEDVDFELESESCGTSAKMEPGMLKPTVRSVWEQRKLEEARKRHKENIIQKQVKVCVVGGGWGGVGERRKGKSRQEAEPPLSQQLCCTRTGRAEQQLGNRGAEHKAPTPRQPTYKAHKRQTRKARPADGQQGSRAAKRKASPTTRPHPQRTQQLAENHMQSKRDRQHCGGGAQTRQSTPPTRSKAAHDLLTSRLDPAD